MAGREAIIASPVVSCSARRAKRGLEPPHSKELASTLSVRGSEMIEAACQEFPPASVIEKVALPCFVRYPANFMNGNALKAFGNFAFELGGTSEE
jgi:hypothetical protein